MALPNPDEMEEFQRLSDKYQPELEVSAIHMSTIAAVTLAKGPLVGQKLPLTALVTEYAQADPTYVTKTRVGFDQSHKNLLIAVGSR